MNFAKFLRAPFFKEYHCWLLLHFIFTRQISVLSVFFLNYPLLDKINTSSIAYVLSLIADFIFKGGVDLRLIVNLLVKLVKILKVQAKIMHNNSSSDCTSN